MRWARLVVVVLVVVMLDLRDVTIITGLVSSLVEAK